LHAIFDCLAVSLIWATARYLMPSYQYLFLEYICCFAGFLINQSVHELNLVSFGIPCITS